MKKTLLIFVIALSSCKTTPSIDVNKIKQESSSFAIKQAMEICQIPDYVSCFKGIDQTKCNGAIGMSVIRNNKFIQDHNQNTKDLKRHYQEQYFNYYLLGQYTLLTAIAGVEPRCTENALTKNKNIKSADRLLGLLKETQTKKEH